MPLRYHSSSSESPMAPRSLQLATGASALHRSAAPISPPETERSVPVLSLGDPQQSEAGGPSPSNQLSPPDGDRTQDSSKHLRRKPSLQYTHSGLNPRSPAQKTTRWLVVVVPPSSLETEPPLGHTLSMSPPGRFQSGILMPLFPTLYSQLAAIGKEFNLPSTSGVCIYLHTSDRGMTFSPRISDESWHLLWSPYFNMEESISPGGISLPIAGQIEFDVDVRRAKWYEAWSNGHEHKISLDTSIPPTIANTMTRWYKEHRSRETSEDLDTPGDDGTTVYSGVQTRSRPVPRPLTLAGREASASSRPVPKQRAVNGLAAGDSLDATSSKRPLYPRQLSPVIQVDEPRTAKQDDLNTLVRNWRASTPLPAVPAGQSQSLPDTQSMIDLDDYQWSISSAGPPRELYSPSLSDEHPLLSGGLVDRMAGSVLMTPSVCTSFGPNDLAPTPTFSNVSRYPSPDIAGRLIDDVGLTPTTATTWGAPLSWPTSAASVSFIETPDVAARGFVSRPATPSTATSWGAPSVWPPSPFVEPRPSTPDLAHREKLSPPPTPATATSWGAPEVWPPSPFEESRPATPDIATREFDEDLDRYKPYLLVWPFTESFAFSTSPTSAIREKRAKKAAKSKAFAPSTLVWPFFEPKVPGGESSPNTLVWPYFIAESRTKEATPSQVVWPYFVADLTEATPSQHVWPYLIAESSTSEATPSHNVWPFFEAVVPSGESSPNSTVWPYFEAQLPVSVGVTGVYPGLCIYPPVYPHLVIYPDSAESLTRSTASAQAEKVCPPFDYPNLVIYPSSATSFAKHSGKDVLGQRQKELSVRLTPPYPVFDLYPAVYPAVTPYPSQTISPVTSSKPVTKARQESKQTLNVRIVPVYPGFDLYPAVYPAVTPYPSQTISSVTSSKPVTKVRQESKQALNVRIAPVYPGFNLYPALYPSVVPYPPCVAPEKIEKISKTRDVSGNQCLSVQLNSHYPFFNLYPPVYPAVVPYPQCRSASSKSEVSSKAVPQTTRLSPPYPFFDLYPAGYPFIAPYPASPLKPAITKPTTKNVNVASQVTHGIAKYPAFDLYPPVYPFFNLYPAIKEKVTGLQSSTRTRRTKVQPLTTRLPSHYPNLDIYPAGYPLIQLYPPVKQKPQPLRVVSAYNYPHLVIYAPAPVKTRLSPVTTRLPRFYPDLELYPAGYPHLEIYPARKVILEAESTLLPGAKYDYPNLCIYPSIGRPQPIQQLTPIQTSQPKPMNPSPAPVTSPTHVRVQARKSSVSNKLTSPQSQRPRKTHSDLHFEVFGRRPRAGTLTSGTQPLKQMQDQTQTRPRKTHADLVFEVFRRSEKPTSTSTSRSTSSISHNRASSSHSMYSTHSRAPSGSVGVRPLRLLEPQASTSVANLRRAVSARVEEAEPRAMPTRSRSTTYAPSLPSQRVRSGYMAPPLSSTMSSSLSSSPEEYEGGQSLLRSSVYSSARSSARSDFRSSRPRNYDAIIEALSSGAETPIVPGDSSGFNSTNSLNGSSKPDVITQRANRFLKQGDYEFLAKRISQTDNYLSGQTQAQAQRQSQVLGQGRRQSGVGLGAATMTSQRPARPVSKLDKNRYPFAQ